LPELVRAADEALYRAKASGRNKVVAAAKELTTR
jgi:PleD family two-component response regulator